MDENITVIKSYRVDSGTLKKVNTILARDGVTISEAIRMYLKKIVENDGLPRGLISNTNDIDYASNDGQGQYIDNIIHEAFPDDTTGKLLLDGVLGAKNSEDVSDSELRNWAAKWGLPDGLSITTLAELRDCGLYTSNPWIGVYDTDDDCTELVDILTVRENLSQNIENVSNKMHIAAVKNLMEKISRGELNNES